MERGVYWQIVEKSMDQKAQERSIAYLAEHLGRFLRKQERVLICFPEHKEGSLGWLMEQAVLRCEAHPVIWGPDHRWQTLLRQTFSQKTSAIIGPPLIILGLTKLKKNNATPLFVRRVITAGYPCPGWMIDGIVKGFDCEVGGCFSLGENGVVAGFACGRSWGVHLRETEFGVDIVDECGGPAAEGELGEIILYPKAFPAMRFATGDNGRLETAPCRCGSSAPRLIDLQPGWREDPDLVQLGQYLHSWTSILDCRLEKGESGLEIEIVCFPGEQLPKLPTAAKLVVRPWDPKTDEPFFLGDSRNIL